MLNNRVIEYPLKVLFLFMLSRWIGDAEALPTHFIQPSAFLGPWGPLLESKNHRRYRFSPRYRPSLSLIPWEGRKDGPPEAPSPPSDSDLRTTCCSCYSPLDFQNGAPHTSGLLITRGSCWSREAKVRAATAATRAATAATAAPPATATGTAALKATDTATTTHSAWVRDFVSCPDTFWRGGARRWVLLAKRLRGTPTREARLRLLMQLALEGPPARLRGTESSARGTGVEAAAAATTTTEEGAAAAAEEFQKCNGVSLVGEWKPIDGCVAGASVRVSLYLPTPLRDSSSGSSSSSGSRSRTDGSSSSNLSESAKSSDSETDSSRDNMNSSSHSINRSSGCRLCCVASQQGARLFVEGQSDSIIVAGLLQLISRSLSGGGPCGIRALRALGPTELLRCSGLLGLLPDVRVRGLRGVLKILMDSTLGLLETYFCEEGAPWGAPGKTQEHSEVLPLTNAQAFSAEVEAAEAAAAEAAAAKASAIAEEVPFLGNEGFRGAFVEGAGGSLHTSSVDTSDENTAKLVETSRSSALPVVGGAGDEMYVLVSGGVDSAVSLKLLCEWGFRPKPVFLKVWAPEALQLRSHLDKEGDWDHQGSIAAAAAAAAARAACPWREDVEAAAAVAASVGLPLEITPMQQQYWERVIQTFLKGAREGLTLNPDWSCNAQVKFGAFAEAIGFENSLRIASGHYARIRMDGGAPRLFRGSDEVKDQSYFLSGLTREQLSRLLLPVGSLWKRQVRKLAFAWGLPSAQRPDSQGLCFLGPLSVGPFLTHLLGEKPGPVLHFPSGAPLGRHRGLWGFTAGQQKGVVPLLDPVLCRRCRGAFGVPPRLSGRWSVVGKIPEFNSLFVVSREEEEVAEERVRALAKEARGAGGSNLGERLLEALRAGDPAALLAVKLRQLRTHLTVENIQWTGSVSPMLEFDASSGSQANISTQQPSAAAVAAAAAERAVAAAATDAAILSGRGPKGAPRNPLVRKEELVVQVRHSAGFDGVSKHKFRVLWATCGASGSTSKAELMLEEPDVGLAPGQVAAFYRGNECLGAGRISALQGASVLRQALLGRVD